MEKYDLIKDDGSWKLKRQGADRASKVFDGTKDDAVRDSAAFMKDHGGSLRIHRETGEFQEERTYPRSADPMRSPG